VVCRFAFAFRATEKKHAKMQEQARELATSASGPTLI
jgi:hypothetical protein